MFKVKGIIKLITDEINISDSFKKREFVLEENSSQYPQYLNFQLTQERCTLINNYTIGDQIEVDFNIRGREWTDKNGVIKYFNSFDVWRISNINNNINDITISSISKIDFLSNDEDETLPF